MNRIKKTRRDLSLNQSYSGSLDWSDDKGRREKALILAKGLSFPTDSDYADCAAGVGKHPILLFLMNRHRYSPYGTLQVFRDFDIECDLDERNKLQEFFEIVMRIRRIRKESRKYRDLFPDWSPNTMQETVASKVTKIIQHNGRMQISCMARYDASLEGLHFIWDEALTREPGSRGRGTVYGYGENRASVVVIGKGGYRFLYDPRLNPYGNFQIAHTHVSRMIEDHGDWYRARFVGSRNNYPCHFTGTAKKNESNGKFYLDKVERPILRAQKGLIQ